MNVQQPQRNEHPSDMLQNSGEQFAAVMRGRGVIPPEARHLVIKKFPFTSPARTRVSQINQTEEKV